MRRYLQVGRTFNGAVLSIAGGTLAGPYLQVGGTFKWAVPSMGRYLQ